MSKLSKYYKVTNQLMIEFISDLYEQILDSDKINTDNIDYKIYQGVDLNLYYIEKPIHDGNTTDPNYYSDMSYFVKFPDKSDSLYTYFGLKKVNDDVYTNSSILWGNETVFDDEQYVLSYSDIKNANICKDKIRVHLIYGFMLDELAGFTLQLKTNVKVLKPKLKIEGYNRLVKDNDGNPVFETITALDSSNQEIQLEQLLYDTMDLTFLDYYFPKECLILNNIIKFHKVPIYQNGAFYDRYIDIEVPSLFYLQLLNINLSVNSVYGSQYNTSDHYDASYNDGYLHYIINEQDYKIPMFTNPDYLKWYEAGRYNLLPKYALPTEAKNRLIIMNVLSDPEVIINFATVRDENSIHDTGETEYLYKQTFFQDPINQIAIKYKSNSDLFNIRIYEDEENAEVIYYPVFGIGNNVVELNYDIMNQIETGAIPMITESFLDKMENNEKFVELYGEDAYKWIIFNDLYVTYTYTPIIDNLDKLPGETDVTMTLHFTNIIDYGIENPEQAGEFWKNTFIPKVNSRPNMICKNILIEYTGRLINRLNNVEAIRTATLKISDVEKYLSRRIALKNVTTYKIVNQIKKQEIAFKNIERQANEKLIRSYYDVTNLVIKDMNNNNLYTLGLMTLLLKHTSHNYMFRLYTLNSDNVRIPYDITGPYRYKLIFPTLSSAKIEIYPNAENSDLDYSIGLLVFYITEELVILIMRVPFENRYFAIVADTENSEQLQSTLYEGKVQYF